MSKIESAMGIQPEIRRIVQPAIADLAGGAILADTVAKVNAILAALRAAGLIKT